MVSWHLRNGQAWEELGFDRIRQIPFLFHIVQAISVQHFIATTVISVLRLNFVSVQAMYGIQNPIKFS
jgi:hypothetical protein